MQAEVKHRIGKYFFLTDQNIGGTHGRTINLNSREMTVKGFRDRRSVGAHTDAREKKTGLAFRPAQLCFVTLVVAVVVEVCAAARLSVSPIALTSH